MEGCTIIYTILFSTYTVRYGHYFALITMISVIFLYSISTTNIFMPPWQESIILTSLKNLNHVGNQTLPSFNKTLHCFTREVGIPCCLKMPCIRLIMQLLAALVAFSSVTSYLLLIQITFLLQSFCFRYRFAKVRFVFEKALCSH